MAIEPRTIVGATAALAIVGVGVWLSAMVLSSPERSHANADAQLVHGSVEVQQIQEPSWTVEVEELGPNDTIQITAAR